MDEHLRQAGLLLEAKLEAIDPDGLVGGFSAAFDLVSSEYGWDDEYIWNLPLCRLRQITAAIQKRRYFQKRDEAGRFSWLARNIAHFIAAGYQVEKGKENPGLDAASKVAYDDIEAVLLQVPKEQTVAKPAENSNGSFERFMSMMQGMDQRGKMI